MVSSLDADHGNPRPGIPLLKIESENKAKQSERIPVIPRVTHTHTHLLQDYTISSLCIKLQIPRHAGRTSAKLQNYLEAAFSS